VAAGEIYLGPDIARELALRQINSDDSPLSQLTAKEFEIFLMLANGNKRATIAETLHISVKTVSNYAHHIKKKLGLSTDAEIVHLAIRYGVIKT
jgi:DNA-binding NarL/FixJ family response regulator